MGKKLDISVVAGKNLQSLRKKFNLTQAQLAEKLEISVSHVANIERAETSISLSLVQRIVELFSITPNDLLLETENIINVKSDEEKIREIIFYNYEALYFSLRSFLKTSNVSDGSEKEYTINHSSYYHKEKIADSEKK